jgi:hypothetical protein
MKCHPAVLAAFASTFFAGCGTTPPRAQTTAAEQQPVCSQEYRVGSMLPKSRCSLPESESERQQTIDTLRKQIPPGGSKAPGGGG